MGKRGEPGPWEHGPGPRDGDSQDHGPRARDCRARDHGPRARPGPWAWAGPGGGRRRRRSAGPIGITAPFAIHCNPITPRGAGLSGGYIDIYTTLFDKTDGEAHNIIANCTKGNGTEAIFKLHTYFIETSGQALSIRMKALMVTHPAKHEWEVSEELTFG